jgi:16S rRNA (guanine(527)-N(7))-methyltransferase RsmG
VSDWRQLPGGEWRRLLVGAGVSALLAESLAAYLVLLGRWESAVDLIGRVDPQTLLRDHVLESLAALEHIPEHGTLLDVGTGNGFPAVPLLLARPGVRGVLLEPRERRWVFLREVLRELGVGAEVRRERLAQHAGADYDVMTVRALGAPVWAGEAVDRLGAGGLLLWWTTAAAAAALGVLGMSRVITSALPAQERGVIAVWRRCST